VIRGRFSNCHSDPDRPGLGGIHHASSVPLSSPGKEAASLDVTNDGVTVIADGADDLALARDMIEVHGAEAATVARDNASAAALSGQALRAKSWIRVLGMIQQQQKHERHSLVGHRVLGGLWVKWLHLHLSRTFPVTTRRSRARRTLTCCRRAATTISCEP
jgi:hypothetical protein